MQELQNIANFDAGGTGNFTGSTNLSSAQNSFLTGEITTVSTVADQSQQCHRRRMAMPITRCRMPQTQQTSMATLYSGFISNIQDTNMAAGRHPAVAEPDALQAALQVTVDAQPVDAAELSAGRAPPAKPLFIAVPAAARL